MVIDHVVTKYRVFMKRKKLLDFSEENSEEALRGMPWCCCCFFVQYIVNQRDQVVPIQK